MIKSMRLWLLEARLRSARNRFNIAAKEHEKAKGLNDLHPNGDYSIFVDTYRVLKDLRRDKMHDLSIRLQHAKEEQ